jgi:hypothetical protein
MAASPPPITIAKSHPAILSIRKVATNGPMPAAGHPFNVATSGRKVNREILRVAQKDNA